MLLIVYTKRGRKEEKGRKSILEAIAFCQSNHHLTKDSFIIGFEREDLRHLLTLALAKSLYTK